MANISKKLLSELTSEEATGPFITFMLNTHHAHQEVEKDQITFKNFAKEAKRRFEKNTLITALNHSKKRSINYSQTVIFGETEQKVLR
jgi:hypothetical protein